MNFKATRRRCCSRHGGSSLSRTCIVLFLVCSLARLTSSLVVRRTQVRPPREWARLSNADTVCYLEDNAGAAAAAAAPAEDEETPKQPENRRRIYASRHNNKQPNSRAMEEKGRKELEWIVRQTTKLLGPDSPPVGTMTQQTIELTLSLMDAWARRASKKESKAPHLVERLLQRLLKERDAENELVTIDTSVYNIVLDGWSNSSEEGSAERSEEIVLHMERMYKEGNQDVQPDEGSYGAAIKAYVKNGNRLIAASKAEELLIRMEQLDNGVKPNRRAYNLVLYALANSSLEDAASRADNTLHKMVKRYADDGDENCKPDINSFNQVLGAWARGRQKDFERRLQTIYHELLELPSEMGVRPNTDTFNAVMGGWLKSTHPKALLFIEQTLATMEKTFDDGNHSAKPDRITINTLNAAYAKIGSPDAIERSMELQSGMEEKYHVKPDTVSQNIVVDSLCKSGRPDAPERVMELLDTMESEFKRGKLASKPDGYTYSSIIGCFVKFDRADGPQKAEKILARMNNLYHWHGGDPVSTSVYNAVLNAWASSQSNNGAARVKELLQLMEENEGKDVSIPSPNRITYNTVIKAMRDGRPEDAAYAEHVLKSLEMKGQSEPHLLPDSYSYTSVITAYGRSEAANKAKKSLELVESMILAYESGNMAAKPSTHSFNAALNACAFVGGDQERKNQAFQIAMKIYELLQLHARPDHTTYGTLLRLCSTLLHHTDNNREKMVDDIFVKACEHGSVGRFVITQMKFAATPNQHIRLTGREIIERVNVKELPRAWTRNVRETNRRA